MTRIDETVEAPFRTPGALAAAVAQIAALTESAQADREELRALLAEIIEGMELERAQWRQATVGRIVWDAAISKVRAAFAARGIEIKKARVEDGNVGVAQ